MSGISVGEVAECGARYCVAADHGYLTVGDEQSTLR
jgi:hypothetical protein